MLLVKSGSTTGKVTIVETDRGFNIWSPLCILRSNTSKILSYFLFNSVKSNYFKTQVELGWNFGTQPNISMGKVENLFISVPPINEQKEILEYLDQKNQVVDESISTEQKRIELLKEYKQSLISEVVTGKIKIFN